MYDDGEAPTFIRVTYQRARNQYRCCECRTRIRPGDTHEYIFGVWDGEPSAYRTCAWCAAMRNRCATIKPDNPPTITDLRDWLLDNRMFQEARDMAIYKMRANAPRSAAGETDHGQY